MTIFNHNNYQIAQNKFIPMIIKIIPNICTSKFYQRMKDYIKLLYYLNIEENKKVNLIKLIIKWLLIHFYLINHF